ncbi:MAG: ornithine carbamoyltransferase [Chloroflexi bacterium]|nr:ornithine carbamoyltransferase [Chloroflexota bacterium]MQC26991.1 ornithine carbamoyltransferase [Chloroflexota bacterium]
MNDFLAIADHSPDEIRGLLERAATLKKEFQGGGNQPILKGKSLAMVFQKPSLRTRVSFEMGMQHLGGHAIYIGPSEIGLGQRESIADVAGVLEGYVDGIMARVFDHQHVLDLAQWSDVPVINGLSDYNHPCQALSDALTIQEHMKQDQKIKVTYVGDGNNVAVSLMHISAKLGWDFTIANPQGFDMSKQAIEVGESIAKESGSHITRLTDPVEAIQDADVIYTDTWTSMGQEEETKKREAVFPPYQVNAALLAKAKPTTIVMHCLPAHRGHEITDEVADGPQSALFPQAHNRLHAQKAILAELLSDA